MGSTVVLTCTVTLDPAFGIAAVDPRLFGSFVEHMGRCVYGGVFEPGHAEADTDGLRLDVLELVRELGITVVRYPGGNFVSGYRWEDGVGPLADRPRRLDLAWRSVETNAFGVNEFMTWARRAGVEPMMAVNLGTRGIQEACDLLEYVNHPGGTHWSDLRRAHGVADPHGIKLWCLGNEMDGPWQVGHKSADAYGALAAETAKAMRQVDPGIKLVACGSSNDRMPTFGSWEATVLDHTFEHVDYISLHAYFEKYGEDRAAFLASGAAMDRFIDGVVATADHVAAKKRSRKRLKLSFDEWNIWYESRFAGHTNLEWAQAPRLIEDEYTAEDAVVVGSLLMSLLRHADRVGVACLAQLVNIIAPIRAEPDRPAWRQTIFHPFALTARHARGTVLRVEPITPTYDTAEHGDVPVADVVATHDPETGHVTLLAVNRSETDAVTLTASLRALPGLRIVEHLVLGGVPDELLHTNNAADPNRVQPRTGNASTLTDGELTAALPPVSWTMLRLAPAA
ncbi:alpha-N-arabinofuranosidase [Dactylosporangium salmoneum]|uniref:non-reducing end alpha-L-arabinofuranosidase n=1 Tax=Dactylosporangium salmoneum TaxID=53361 RepID=A0ABN3G5N0_9ACTN